MWNLFETLADVSERVLLPLMRESPIAYFFLGWYNMLKSAAERYIGALTFGSEPPKKIELIHGIVR